jgi:hypothetical protein
MTDTSIERVDAATVRYPGRAVRLGMVAGVVCAFCLIAYGLYGARTTLGPSAATGVAAAAVVLPAYAATAWFGVAPSIRAEPRAFRLGCRAGVAVSAVFAFQVFGEYLLPVTGRVDQAVGLIVFGGLLPLNFVLGAVARTAAARAPAVPGPGSAAPGRFRAGVVASLWAMMIGSLAWLNCLLAAYLAFRGTAAERRLFDAEGVGADFARSGEHDLRAFLITDYLGACFFHLTLGPAIGAACAGLGASAVGLWSPLVRRLRRDRINVDDNGVGDHLRSK